MSKIKPVTYSLVCKFGAWIFHALPEEFPCSQCLECCHFTSLHAACSHCCVPVYRINQVLWMKDFFFPSLLKPTNRNILCTNQALAPSLTGTTDHTCSTDGSKLRNMHRRAALGCTQAALGLSPESHGSRGGGGLVSVKNSFLFCNCNPGVHSLLGRVFHRETAELVLPCLKHGAAEHHPPPRTGGLQPGPRPTLPAESTRHPQKNSGSHTDRGFDGEVLKDILLA